ncbi:MAG: hypothetical protein ACFBRM_11005 [Pikeienuella sp.]
MRRAGLLGAALLIATAAAAAAAPPHAAVDQCLYCHLDEAGTLDIVGVRALAGLPAEWPFLFEDAFDLDGDGIAGAMRFVSAGERPRAAKYGQSLAAASFEDFALIAGAAHGIDLSQPAVMAAVKRAFQERSLDPQLPFATLEAQARFEARGCAACHVTRSYVYQGKTYMPLSDFLLHDLGAGPRRTKPLWGCPDCLTGPGHATPAGPIIGDSWPRQP